MAAPPPQRSPFIRLLNEVGKRIAPRWPSLDPEGIIEQAARGAKSRAFGDTVFREALPILIDAVEREADLTWIGRVACRHSLTASLQSRFAIYRYREEHPEIRDIPIEKPLFIVGLPRTGTTVLFNLMAQDPSNRAPLGWEVQFPDPPPDPRSFRTDRRIQRARKYFGQMDKMAPSLASIHEIGAELPQECLPILAHSLLSPQASLTFNVPSYQDWVDTQDPAPSYDCHRHFLEHLQSRYMRERWVLKSPVHLATLDSLLDAYPDARLVFTHRDPVKTIPSLASLIYTVRGIVTDSVDPTRVGPEQLSWWANALEHAMAVRRARTDKASQFIDVQFEEIVVDPVAAVARIYDRFAIPWSETIEAKMRAFLADNPRGKFGPHRYTLEDFGLDRGSTRERFETYCRTYDVPLDSHEPEC